MFTHIVFANLTDPTPENINKARDLLQSLEGNVPQVRQLEVGVDVIRSERSFDVSLYTKFDSREDMDAYQVHPFHKGVLGEVAKLVSAVVAVDYETD